MVHDPPRRFLLTLDEGRDHLEWSVRSPLFFDSRSSLKLPVVHDIYPALGSPYRRTSSTVI